MPRTRQVGLGDVLFDLVLALMRLRPKDWSLSAGSVLSTLERTGAQRLGDLAAHKGVAQPSMTALVDQLCRRGLTERRPDPDDGRAVLVAITERGRVLRQEKRAELAHRVSNAIAELASTEAEALDAALPALRHLVEALVTAPLVATSSGRQAR